MPQNTSNHTIKKVLSDGQKNTILIVFYGFR
ncbi:Uncharacterised protein [Serratia quinivorans]|nr:Uncharacterised protein [Serratia quinivorans]